MKYIKKYMFLIVCVVIFVLGAGLLAWGMVMNAGNTKQYQRISGLSKTVGQMRGNAVPKNVLEQYKQIASLARAEAEKVSNMVRLSTQRPLIYDKVFPKVQDPSNRVIFYQRYATNYAKRIENYLKLLNAGDRPSKLEEDQAIQDFHKSSGQGSSGRSSTFRYNFRQNDDSPEAQILTELRREKAGTISIYANGDSFCAYQYWKLQPNKEELMMLKQTWYSQLADWIQEDVVLAINQVNSTDKTVFQNPVKRLVEISFVGEEVPLESQSGSGSGSSRSKVVERRKPKSENALPSYVLEQEAATSNARRGSSSSNTDQPKQFRGHIVYPWTDNASNELMDFVHFEIAVIIDSVYLFDFINALQSVKYTPGPNDEQLYKRKQILVLDMQMEPVDMEQENFGGFYYGPGALKVLRLTCEYFFYKKGYDHLKPEPIVEVFAQTDK